MESDKYQIPRFLDDPFKIILWTVDEFLALVMPLFVLLVFFDAPITGVVIGVLAMFLLKKLKGEQGHYFLHALVYWHLPQIVVFKSTPPSYIRDFLG